MSSWHIMRLLHCLRGLYVAGIFESSLSLLRDFFTVHLGRSIVHLYSMSS